MFMILDRWFAGQTVRRWWRRSERAVLARIQSFEATEDDSAWQLLHAASSLSESASKAQLFMQALEETHHAEIFRELYRQSAGQPLRKISVERHPLLRSKNPQETWKLFVYFSVGERSAARRFQAIAGQLEDGPFRRSLQKILAEEEGHCEMAGQLAALTGQTRTAIGLETKKVQMRRAVEAWLRMGRHLTALLSRGLLIFVYYTLGSLLRKGRAK